MRRSYLYTALLVPALFGSASAFAANTVYKASDFTNSLGVGIHMGAGENTLYGNIPGVVNDLSYLGFKHVRDSIGGTQSGSTNYHWVGPLPKLEAFASIGVYSDAIFSGDPATYQAWLDQNAQYIESLEGPNEPEFTTYTYKNLTGTPAAVAIQQAAYAMIKGDKNLASKPVLNLSFSKPADTAAVGNLSPYANYGNIHSYPSNGNPPYMQLPASIAGTVDTPGRPNIMTETGYATFTGITTGSDLSSIVPEDIQAKYLLDAVFDNFNAGVAKTYLYELYDTVATPLPQLPTDADKENHFGLFRGDETPKPVAVGFHNLMTILHDSGANAASYTPTAFNYTLQQSLQAAVGTDINTHNALFQKQDGTYELVLWGEPALWQETWNPTLRTTVGKEVAAPANSVIITFPTLRHNINVYDPMTGTTPTTQYDHAGQVVVSITDHPIIVEIGPQVDGACGASNGVTLASAPSANLCTIGSASSISGSGPWSWSCGGISGGSTAACSASAPQPVANLASTHQPAACGQQPSGTVWQAWLGNAWGTAPATAAQCPGGGTVTTQINYYQNQLCTNGKLTATGPKTSQATVVSWAAPVCKTPAAPCGKQPSGEIWQFWLKQVSGTIPATAAQCPHGGTVQALITYYQNYLCTNGNLTASGPQTNQAIADSWETPVCNP